MEHFHEEREQLHDNLLSERSGRAKLEDQRLCGTKQGLILPSYILKEKLFLVLILAKVYVTLHEPFFNYLTLLADLTVATVKPCNHVSTYMKHQPVRYV